jgi:septal ring factor EnvC (AmiA/AmiB activator)
VRRRSLLLPLSAVGLLGTALAATPPKVAPVAQTAPVAVAAAGTVRHTPASPAEIKELAARAAFAERSSRRAAGLDRARASEADAERAAAQHDLDLLEDNRQTRVGRLKARIALIYRVQDGGLARLLVAPSDETGDLFADRAAAARLIARDRDELAQLDASIARAQSGVDTLTQTRDQALASAASDDALNQTAHQAALRTRALVNEGRAATAGEIDAARNAVAALPSLPGEDCPGPFVRPVTGKVAYAFGPYIDPPTGAVLVRRGVLYAAKPGSRVLATAAGTVRFTGVLPGYGNTVLIDHGDGLLSITSGLATIAVRQDQTLLVGATLGVVSNDPLDLAAAPAGAPPCVYLELRDQGMPIDPTAMMQ